MARHKITNQPRFEFRAAAFEALRDFPQLRANTTFLMEQQNPAGQATKAYGDINAVTGMQGHRSWTRYLRGFMHFMRNNKTSVACFVKGIPHQAVIFTPHSQLSAVHPDRAAMLFFEFDHELGHLLTKHGREMTRKSTTTRAEISAEAFAVLRSIQRFGGAREHLEALSVWRAQGFVASDIRTHITTPVIDAIVADAARVDFCALTPEQTIIAANEYTERYCPPKVVVDFTAAQMRSACKFKTSGSHQIRLASMLKSTTNDFAFVTGARALMPVLASDINAQLDRGMRDVLILQIQQRAKKLGLDDTLDLLKATSNINEPETKKPGSRAPGYFRIKR